MEYAELHCHSSFSLLDGASNPEELVARAKQIGLSALALTDHDDMGGIVRFAHAAKEVGLEGIVGAELTLQGETHLTLLAQNLEGYKNLCYLITQARSSCERGTPRLSLEQLTQRSSGLVALSGCPHGQVPTLIAQGKFDQAQSVAGQIKEIFADNFFIEMWDHHVNQEAFVCKHLLDISKRLDIPPVVTNDAHYAFPEKRIIHDVLTCLRHEVTLQTAGRRLRPNGSWYLKTPQEITHQWRHFPEAVKNTLLVAERCKFRHGQLHPELPACRVPPGLKYMDYLRQLVWEGAAERYGNNLSVQHINQLNHELTLIEKLNLSAYFLLMREIVDFAISKGIAVQGRGSAANSAVCYCLKITAVDPIGMDLLFERFISEERNEPPDIDLDIAHQEREIVLQHVYEKYGREHAAMVCEHITYRGPSAVRDAARVFDFSPEQADRLAAEAHFGEASEAAIGLLNGGAERAGLDIKDRRVQLLIQVVAGLHQLPRHRSIHVGGFVLSGEPLGQIVPIEPASMEGRTVIQWDKDDLDIAGLIKVDLLGLGMLTLIQEAVKHVEKHRQFKLDLAQLDMHDPKIFNMLQKADTIGLFQVESRAQMSILPKLRPSCFYDIVISIALVRPGPIQGNIIHPYLKRRRGLEEVTYLHPSIEPILKRTLGVPLFQEQGMKLAVVAAGFTASQADSLRRVMSHKRSLEKMNELCVDLAAGMRKNGLSDEAIEIITFQLKSFANYGFPESHSASFALLVYASAHLKAYYAPEFFCAILNAQPMGFYSPATLVRDAIRHGVEIRPVDISNSLWDCTLEDRDGAPPALRIGLRYIRGLGRRAQQTLENAWQTDGAFLSLEDVCKRSGLRPKDLEHLAAAGAFACFCPDRRQALWEILRILKTKDEPPLLKLLRLTADGIDNDPIPPMNDIDCTIADYKRTGLSSGKHPMTYYRDWLQKKRIKSCGELEHHPDGAHLIVAGGVICRQRPGTAKGFVFLTLEDETGMANIIVKPALFEMYKQVLLNNHFLAIQGRLQSSEGVINLLAEKIHALPQINNERSLHLHARNFH
ncbi:MAG TPA: error-prone DNA polymerase [Candidatus Obscuribacterales bacterium]